MTDLVTIGWLTVDDIVLENGTTFMGQPGGGALHSAIGARVWSRSVGINAAAGRTHIAATHSLLERTGIDAAGIVAARADGIEFWLLHESEINKQQVAKKTSQRPLELDDDRGALPADYATARGFHIAPQGPLSGIQTARALGGRGAVVTMDILSDAIIDVSPYRDLSWTRHLDAFLPSEAEIAEVWAPSSPLGWLSDRAREGACHMIGKFGSRGCVVAEAGTGHLTEVPALDVDVVDTTGAGDSFCGGFLAGLAMGHAPVYSAAMGTVSASLAIEVQGVPLGAPSRVLERDERLRRVLASLTTERRSHG